MKALPWWTKSGKSKKPERTAVHAHRMSDAAPGTVAEAQQPVVDVLLVGGVEARAPRAVRRTKANAMSTMGTPRMKQRDEQRGEEEVGQAAEAPAVGTRPPMTMVDAAISSPRNSAPASPMKIRAGWKLRGRKPMHTPQAITATSGPMLSAGRSPSSIEPQPVDGQGAAADGHDAGGQAVEAVDEVHGVGDDDDPERRDQRGDAGGQHEEADERDLELDIVTPRKYRMLAASTCPAILAGADISRTSSMSPTAKIAPPAEHHAQRLGRVLRRCALRNAGMAAATSMATRKARNMAAPPP